MDSPEDRSRSLRTSFLGTAGNSGETGTGMWPSWKPWRTSRAPDFREKLEKDKISLALKSFSF